MSDIRWMRVILVGLGAFLTTIAVVFLIVTGYAFKLGFEARGAPDPDQINEFAESVAPTASAIALALLVFIGGWWTARKVSANALLHGTLVGAVAALVGTAGSLFSENSSVIAVLTGLAIPLAAGTLGGFLGGGRSS